MFLAFAKLSFFPTGFFISTMVDPVIIDVLPLLFIPPMWLNCNSRVKYGWMESERKPLPVLLQDLIIKALEEKKQSLKNTPIPATPPPMSAPSPCSYSPILANNTRPSLSFTPVPRFRDLTFGACPSRYPMGKDTEMLRVLPVLLPVSIFTQLGLVAVRILPFPVLIPELVCPDCILPPLEALSPQLDRKYTEGCERRDQCSRMRFEDS
ncbi:hypothetical protein B9Z19DRAFT_1163630 [Tuber borchii]|uniref:Uncharacterized protein n=1 Tax=Tuber borchii TaxID=42251 RepID=A0A2T6ZD09_TUBBO|nr:hypothetical protein B9Z19DRAFT_1163630 [Tuber borchii]